MLTAIMESLTGKKLDWSSLVNETERRTKALESAFGKLLLSDRDLALADRDLAKDHLPENPEDETGNEQEYLLAARESFEDAYKGFEQQYKYFKMTMEGIRSGVGSKFPWAKIHEQFSAIKTIESEVERSVDWFPSRLKKETERKFNDLIESARDFYRWLKGQIG